MKKTCRLRLMATLIAVAMGLISCGSDIHSDQFPDSPMTTTGTR